MAQPTPHQQALAPQPGRNARRELARVLAAEGISNFGAMLSRLAIPWLAALVLEATPLQMAVLLVADVAAAALSALCLGAWVERRGKRAVMLFCDGARAAVLALLALLAWGGAASMPVLALAAAASGVLTMAFEVARSAWMAQRLAAGELMQANARLSVATSLSETAAFAMGGWLFQWLGAAVALGVDAMSYLASAMCLRSVREVPAVQAAAADGGVAVASSPGATASQSFLNRCRDAWQEVSAGLAAVRGHPTLRTLAVVEALLALSMSLAGTSYMIYVVRDLAIPTGQLGLIFAAGGLGAVIGARLAARAGRRFGIGVAMAAGLVAVALGAALVPLATGAGALVIIALLLAQQLIGDAGHTLYAVHGHTLRQTEVQASLLARTDAAIRFGGQAATLGGALLGGLVGTAIGARATLVLCAAVAGLAAAYALWCLRELRRPGA